jgi:hypothetical protein
MHMPFHPKVSRARTILFLPPHTHRGIVRIAAVVHHSAGLRPDLQQHPDDFAGADVHALEVGQANAHRGHRRIRERDIRLRYVIANNNKKRFSTKLCFFSKTIQPPHSTQTYHEASR